jgi:hypothetical protein
MGEFASADPVSLALHDDLSERETQALGTISQKTRALGDYLSSAPAQPNDPAALFTYLTGAKTILGNLNNDLSLLATMMAKRYLRERFEIEFDSTRKPQGAPGIDIDINSPIHGRIVAEIKTTKPYQPGFGANQKIEILKDFGRLANTVAKHRFMFVTDSETFETLCGAKFSSRVPGVEIVNVISRQRYTCGEQAIASGASSFMEQETASAATSNLAGQGSVSPGRGGNKYDSLRDYLRRQSFDEFSLTFREIEQIIGSSLPASAERPQFWANVQSTTIMNPLRQACRAGGYDTFLISGSRKVRFRKAK